MSDIPAPLLNRHTAIAVAIFTVLGVAATFLPNDELGILIVRQVVLAAQAVVLALAVFLVGRTLARASLLTSLLAAASLLLLAVVRLVAILRGTRWGEPIFAPVLPFAELAAGSLVVLGLVSLGVAVLRHGVWRGPTRVTLVVAGLSALVVVVLGVLGVPIATPYALWSLTTLGLVAGLRTRRVVPVSGIPDSQLGAAQV
jgi:hypothetical protein